jgi:RNA polymerase sigma-70 factor (ECF subfamily)
MVRRNQVAARRQSAIVHGLRRSLSTGDRSRVQRILHPGMTLVVDGGGRVPAPAGPVRGRAAAADALIGMFGPRTGSSSTVVSVNGAPALVFRRAGGVVAVLTLRTRGARVFDAWIVANPDKLRHWNSL